MANETEKDKKHREREAERGHAEGRKTYKSEDEGDERKRGDCFSVAVFPNGRSRSGAMLL